MFPVVNEFDDEICIDIEELQNVFLNGGNLDDQ